MRTVTQIVSSLKRPNVEELPPPSYKPREGKKIALMVEDMRNHTADAGWQLTKGLEFAGYELWGHGFDNDETDVAKILEEVNPSVVVMQDKREWDGGTVSLNRHIRFKNVEALKERDDIFKVTVLKDAHQRPHYHKDSADEIGCHAWIIYYHPRIVKQVAPYVRLEHCIRTTHSVNAPDVPEYQENRRKRGSLISGALSTVYPLRVRIVRNLSQFPRLKFKRHPGYHNRGCVTPQYLRSLSKYKVAICTSSIWGYTLRKIIEATACGCRVITDLPQDDVLPSCDNNLIRVHPSISIAELSGLIADTEASYDYHVQKHISEKALGYYNFASVGLRLAEKIQNLKRSYDHGKEKTEETTHCP